VLDTGSTDDTAEKLRQRGAQVTVETVSPWRFDTARNRSLELTPEDADICVCTDLDEVFRVCVEVVDSVETALAGFIRKADEAQCWTLGREAENLQMDNSADRTQLLEAWSMWDNGVSASSFDKYVRQLYGGEDD